MSINETNMNQISRFFVEIIRIRTIEQTIAERYKLQEMKCPIHLSIGQEGPAVGISMFLSQNDKMLSTHRSHAHYLAKGGSLERMICEFHGAQEGCSSGMGGSMHLIDKDCGFEGATAIVGNTIPIANGIALSQKLSNQDNITVVCLGEGATEEGVFYETLNLASLKQLPIMFFIENNRYSVYSPLNVRQSNERSITGIAEAHGIRTFSGDGNKAEEVIDVCKLATEHVRKKRQPCLIELSTHRCLEHCGPNNDDHLHYRPKEELAYWSKNDVIQNTKLLLTQYGLEVEELEQKVKAETTNKLEDAFALVKHSSLPSLERSSSYEYA